MGATPTFALNIFGFPINDLPNEVAGQILKGGSDKANEAGIPILGGHSIDDKEPKYGLIVNGLVNEDKLIRNSGANSGDVLILTKPIEQNNEIINKGSQIEKVSGKLSFCPSKLEK